MSIETAAPTAGTNTTDPGSTAPATTAAPATLLTPTPAPADAAPAATPAQPTDAAPADAKPADAPIEYADFTAPEGVTLNADALGTFKAFAAEKGLSQEDAQKLVDLGADAVQRQNAAIVSQIEQAQAKWSEASRTDKEFGGDKLSENLGVAQQAIAAFGSPELVTLLAESGLGNHPEVIRTFYRVGKAVSEDKNVPGGTKPAGGDALAKMYPTMTQN